MITLTTEQCLLLKPAIENIIKYTEQFPLDFSVSYKFSKIINKIQKILIEYEQKNNKFIFEFGKSTGKKDENENDIYEINYTDGENYIKYLERRNVLFSEKHELTGVYLFKIEELKDLKIPLNNINSIINFLVEPISKTEEEIKEEQSSKDRTVEVSPERKEIEKV